MVGEAAGGEIEHEEWVVVCQNGANAFVANVGIQRKQVSVGRYGVP